MSATFESFKSETKELAAEQAARISELSQLPESKLTNKPNPKAWSALECLEHLSLCYDFYLPKLKEAIEKGSRKPYKPSSIMRWATQSLRPKEDGRVSYKMKTFSATTPAAMSAETEQVIARINTLHKTFEALILRIESEGQLSVKLVSLAGPMVKFKVGDAIRFLLAHNDRHLSQAYNATLS